jgi:DNA polymerase (family X)
VKAEIVDLLVGMGLELRRLEEPYRSRAYLRAANEIARRLEEDIVKLVEEDRLRELRGVGPAIDGVVRRFVASGERPEWVPATTSSVVAAAEALEAPEAFASAPFADAPDLHCHTTWSDGSMTMDELAAFAERLGARAVGISDHSGSLRIARGLDADAVRLQWEDIARVQRAHPHLKLLKGTECDILRDGALDHPAEVLAGLDYVIGSLHSHLRLPEREQTDRLLAAFEDERLTILGHPTTRVPGHRPPANLDLPRVFRAAADLGVALEVNGNRGRLDLDVTLAAQALKAGARLSIGSDAHYARELFESARARRMAAEAGARERDVANLDFVPALAPA